MTINSSANVLITGGTKGLGLSLAKAYSKTGATVHITHKWGSVSDAEVYDVFDQHNLPRPLIYCSDVGNTEDNRNLVQSIIKNHANIDIFISNVCFSQVAHGFTDLKLNSLDLSLQYSAWPIVAITQEIFAATNNYPKYIIGVSSNGPDMCHAGYDYAACAKSVLETLSRYMALRLKDYDCTVNCIRPGFLDTDSTKATFGKKFIDLVHRNHPDLFMDPNQIANVCLALTSGLMDAVKGQVITVDNGQELVSMLDVYNRLL